jgi:UDP-glucose 4-epimerase
VRILVVGGAGFIGSHLVDRLLAEQHAVDVVDDLSTGSLANLAAARAAGGELKIHHLDACAAEFPALVAMRSPEVVYHLGWAPPGRTDPGTWSRALQSSWQVLEAARANDVAKVVTALPAVAHYGDLPSRELPAKEGRVGDVVGPAGIVVRAIAELHAVYRARHDVEFSALAVTNVYGSRQRADGGVVAAFRSALAHGEAPVIHGDGRQARDFVFIDDVVDALVRAATRGGGLVINIGTGVLTSVRELWSAVAGPAGAAPTTGRRPDDQVLRLSVSPTRARIHLAWAPWTGLAEGLAASGRSD